MTPFFKSSPSSAALNDATESTGALLMRVTMSPGERPFSAATLSFSIAVTITPFSPSTSKRLAKSALMFCTVMPSSLAVVSASGLRSDWRIRLTAVNSSGNAPVSTSISRALPLRIRPSVTESPAFLSRSSRLSSSADFTMLPSTSVMTSANSRSEFSAGPPETNCRTTTPSSTPTAKSR